MPIVQGVVICLQVFRLQERHTFKDLLVDLIEYEVIIGTNLQFRYMNLIIVRLTLVDLFIGQFVTQTIILLDALFQLYQLNIDLLYLTRF